jgi:hypothetical protein
VGVRNTGQTLSHEKHIPSADKGTKTNDEEKGKDAYVSWTFHELA